MSNKQTQLDRQLEQLPHEIQPQRDLWKGIELGIESRERKSLESSVEGISRPWRYSIAASFATVGLVGWLALQQFSVVPNDQNPSLTKIANALTEQHQLQKQQLLVSLQDQPALTENWEQQLVELDEAADAIKAALAQDPNNAALLKMLQNVYQQQMNLIERVHTPKWRQI